MLKRNVFLNKRWQQGHFAKIVRRAGPRYTPELNVELPINKIFDGLARNAEFYVLVRKHLGELLRSWQGFSTKEAQEHFEDSFSALRQKIGELFKLISRIKSYDTTELPWNKIEVLSNDSYDLAWQIINEIHKIREQKELEKRKKQPNEYGYSPPVNIYDSEMHYLSETRKELLFFKELSSSVSAGLSNNPFLFVNGLAGSGKTHLLCDLAERRLKVRAPTVLVFGEFFQSNTNIWDTILKQAGLTSQITGKKQFLTLLDEAAQKANSRAILIVDALNESATGYWKKNLNSLVKEVAKYKNIGVIVSLRMGFEKEVLTKTQIKKFIQEEHVGFRFKEWEALQKFFSEFRLPLPEIPLLMPEFQNPLFLLLFCKGLSSRSRSVSKKGTKSKREIFRGHEGATFIFENFVKNSADQIAKKFSLPPGRKKNGQYIIWDTVIEKIAEKMVTGKYKDRISESSLKNIVSQAHPQIDSEQLIKELDRNLLVIKIPRYSDRGRQTGYYYRFPFQKFSDHLIVRFLLNKYLDKKQEPSTLFQQTKPLGKAVSKYYNAGIIEALSIQIPERLKGLELVDVAPNIRNKHVARNSFLESIIWRKPTAFIKDERGHAVNALCYINEVIIKTEASHHDLLNTLLTVAPIPNHPLNARLLHRHLWRIKMPIRDSWWSTFLHHSYGEKGAVDRLIEWAWSQHDKTNINDEAKLLAATALAWFLTTPNRFLRDRATKGLVSLLNDNLGLVKLLLKRFLGVDDPYVSERLYAFACGCALRNQNSKNLGVLAFWVYKNIFENNNPPVHILLRDYARGIIETAIHQKIQLNIDIKKIRPPYKSKWPTRIPGVETLKRKYYPEDFFKDKTKERGYLDIWSSVMHNFGTMGDFGKYVVNSNLDHWSGRKLSDKNPSREEVLNKFLKSLNSNQRELWNKKDPFYGIDLVAILKKANEIRKKNLEEDKTSTRPPKEYQYEQPEPGKENLKKPMEKLDSYKRAADREFRKSLTQKQKTFYDKEIKPFLDRNIQMRDPLDNFNTGLAQRWIFNRVVQLGWNQKLHGEFDGIVNYSRADRSEHKPERIGKKYQWIAFHEFLALVADHFEFKDEIGSGKKGNYEGPWQIYVRDIDPSCLLKDFPNQPPSDTPIIDWDKFKKYNSWNTNLSDRSWIKKEKHIPMAEELIEVKDDKGGKWLILNGFVDWQEPIPPEEEKFNIPTRRLWYIIKGYFIKMNNQTKFTNWAKKQNFMGRWMPVSHEFYHVFIGEYPWAQSFLNVYKDYGFQNGWSTQSDRRKIPVKVLITDNLYVSSGSSIDCSVNEAISIKLPSKWIAVQMELQQLFGDGRFYDRNGDLVVIDPAVFDINAPRVLLIKKTPLLRFINSKNLGMVWTLLGEKNIIGGHTTPENWVGRLEVSGAYSMDRENTITGNVTCKFVS